MPLSLEQVRSNTAKARATMQRARAEHFALGAFNLDDEATLKAVAMAAANKRAPVLVEVSQGEVDTIGLNNVRDMVDNFKREFDLEIYVNLDHSPSVDAAKKASTLASNSYTSIFLKPTTMPLMKRLFRPPKKSLPTPPLPVHW